MPNGARSHGITASINLVPSQPVQTVHRRFSSRPRTLRLPSTRAAQVWSFPAARDVAVTLVPRSTASKPVPISPGYLPLA